MKTKVKIRNIKGKYIITLPKFLIDKIGLEDGSILTAYINENTINITNMKTENSSQRDIIEENLDVFSKVLKEEQLILAK